MFTISFLLILVRLVIGKTTFDRILAANSIGTLIVLGISVHGFYMGRPEFIDISIVYALINFIATVAVLRLFDTDLGPANCLQATENNGTNEFQVISIFLILLMCLNQFPHK